MMPNLDPKKMSAIMKQMGIAQEQIVADRVIIERSEGGKIIIDNPNVVKIKMQGQESFQITGEVSEETQVESSAEENLEADLASIIEQTGVSKEIAAIELEKNNGDIAETIIALSDKKKK
jgi:nascent polypeptide-associated complex subunit alpha